jgi:hypothetical protein
MKRDPALDQLCSYENLFWAWQKVVVFCHTSDTWYDESEFRGFELHLRENLLGIATAFAESKYQTAPLRPLPQPKRDANGAIEIRQAFWVSIRDQVAWLAYVNVVGPEIDSLMPAWSYGHRLYRSITIADADRTTRGRTIVGPHRNSRGLTYRRWPQSWPLFRRHVLLTVRQMAKAQFALPETEQRILETEGDLEQTLRLPYLNPEYWEKPISRPHWCSFDIEKFYPSVTLERVRSTLFTKSLMAQQLGLELLSQLTSFQFDLRGWNAVDMNAMGLGKKETTCPFIPTGLSVAGFLANAAMLGVDEWVKREARERQLAHFRYVDDHLVLARTVKDLAEWIGAYRTVLESDTGCKLKDEKTRPEKFRDYLREKVKRSEAKKATALDPEFPSPLMTETLAKISDLSRIDFNLLDPENQRRVLHDLHHLLLTDFPDEEIAEKTRVSFAATLIARVTPRLQFLDNELTKWVLRRAELTKATREAQSELQMLRSSSRSFSVKLKQIRHASIEVRRISKRIRLLDRAQQSGRSRHSRRALAVLKRAVELHPEKLRLWERTLDFIRNITETPGEITRLIDALEMQNALAAVLVRSKIRQVVSHHCFGAAQRWLSLDWPTPERRDALDYLLNAAVFCKALHFEREYYYERHAQRAFDCSLAISLEIVSDRRNPGMTSNQRNLLRRALRDYRRTALRLSSSEIWWLALELSSRGISEHSRRLRKAASRLSATSVSSWRIWGLLDQPPPLAALKQLAGSPSATEKGDTGWLLDALAFREDDLAKLRNSKNREIRRISRMMLRKRRRWLLLPQWIQWTGATERDPYDPRLSEWTALEIVRLIANNLGGLPASVRRIVATSCFNFSIPRPWIDVAPPVGWETWRAHVTQNSVIKARRRAPVYDSRTDPGVEDFSEIDFEFGSVRSLGIILLALIRRDFRIPLVRGNTPVSGTLSKLAIRQVQDKPCSSRTMAVLEACLMDRSTETFMLSKRGVSKDELDADTTNDVPLINTIQQFVREVKVCQRILVNHQSTIAAHKPRQLIPLYLGQYTRKNWRSDPDDAEIQNDAF